MTEERRVTLEPKRKLGYALGVMEGHLKDREFFVGERYSIADFALYAYTHVAHEEAATSAASVPQRLAEADRGAARARTYNVGLARTVREMRFAQAEPSRLELGRCRGHGRPQSKPETRKPLRYAGDVKHSWRVKLERVGSKPETTARSFVDVAVKGTKVRPRLPRGFPLVDGTARLDALRLENLAGTLDRTRPPNVDLNLACPSIPIYLKPPDLAETPRARLVSGHGANASEGRAMGTTKVKVSRRLALACGGCGEVILFLGRERDWYEAGAEGRPRSFMCSGCGERLTLADRVMEAPRTMRNSGS